MDLGYDEYSSDNGFLYELDELYYSVKDRLDVQNMSLLENRFWFKYKMWTTGRNVNGNFYSYLY